MSNENFDAFVEAYNNFDSRPLKGESLRKYYLEDITQDVTNSIIKTIKITEKYRKILIIGHTGCGKSTVLNKVADELKDMYHIVSFSVAEELNMMDVETIDILLTIYMQLIYSMKDREITPLLNKFETFMKSLKDKLGITEAGVGVIKSVSYKIKVESKTRDTVRKALNTQAEQLQNNLSEACKEISRIIKKDVLVIIDDLDKLKDEFAEKIFCDEPHLLIMPEAKIIFTFPLSTYYSPPFVQKVTDMFTHKFIRLIDLHDIKGKYKEDSLIMMKKLVLKRIDKKLVNNKALKNLVDKSGGLVRDLIKLMQEACSVVIDEELSIIDGDVSWKVIYDKINEYNRIFDFPKYKNDVLEIMGTQNKDEIENENLIYLLRYLFVLEYGRRGEESWFDVHPCLKECFNRRKL
ncbi:MAG: AAA family ATPase [Desulfobacterales bacterium]|nr:AAA family ATPase [Desulfobacterales bacterium]